MIRSWPSLLLPRGSIEGAQFINWIDSAMSKDATNAYFRRQRLRLPPVILLGMHRSGTSLIARLLDELGLFQGHELQEDHESTHFLDDQRYAVAASRGQLGQPSADACFPPKFPGGRSDGPLPAGRPGGKADRRVPWQETCGTAAAWKNSTQPWGWKDPRTVFTLPLWLKVFPRARLVYIVRNGVDVASSLRVREARELARRIEEFDAKQKNTGRLTNHSLLQRAGFKGSARCLTLDGAFSLWEEYVAEAERQLAAAPNERLIVNYERFLAEPADPNNGLAALVKFCGLSAPADALESGGEEHSTPGGPGRS